MFDGILVTYNVLKAFYCSLSNNTKSIFSEDALRSRETLILSMPRSDKKNNKCYDKHRRKLYKIGNL